MTEDKKCIVRGRRTTKYVLTTIGEQCNYKVLTCKQNKVTLNNVNRDHVYLTDDVKKLYNTDQEIHNSDIMPKLVAVKAQTQYKIQL